MESNGATQGGEEFRERKSSPEKQLVAFCLAALLLSALAVAAALLTGHRATAGFPVCHTVDCERHAAELTNRLVGAASPCVDWSRFVCSAWRSAHPTVDSAPHDAAMGWSSRLADLVPQQIFFPAEARKAARAIIACLDRSSENASESRSALLEFLEERMRMKTSGAPAAVATLVEEVVYYAVNWMLPLLFNVALLATDDAPRGRALVLFPSDLVTIWLKIITEQRTHGTYNSLWKHLFRITSGSGIHFDLDAGADIAEDVLSTLDNITEFEHQASVLVTVGKLGEALGLPPGEELAKGFRPAFPVSPVIDADDVVFASHRKIVSALSSLIKRHGAGPMTAFLRWWVLFIVGLLSDSIFIREHAGVREVSDVMTLVCTTETEATYGLALNTADKEHFDQEQIDSLRQALDNVKSTLVLSIDHLSYINDSAKLAMTDQLKSVHTELWGDSNVLRVGNESLTLFPYLPEVKGPFLSYWLSVRERMRSLDDSVVRYRLPYVQRRTVPGTLVRYEPFSRTVIISPAALAAPYYYAEGTKAMFYGGIGFIYAKALLQSIDYQPRLAPSVGGDLSTGLSPKFDRPSILKRCASGVLFRDAFPDMAAIEIAHAALQRDNDHYRLPGMETLDTDHIYFMTLCLGSCRESGRSRFSDRCNRAVMQSRLFAHVLQCKTKMNLCNYF